MRGWHCDYRGYVVFLLGELYEVGELALLDVHVVDNDDLGASAYLRTEFRVVLLLNLD